MELSKIKKAILNALEVLRWIPKSSGIDLTEIGSSDYMNLCAGICGELKSYCSIEETVTAQADTFSLEMSGFLREMDCPYQELIGIDALNGISNRLLLLDYLLSEIMACRMAEEFQDMENEASMHPILKPIFSIMSSLQLDPPQKQDTTLQTFTNIEKRVCGILSGLPPPGLGETLLSKQLDEVQWGQVEKLNEVFSEEYQVRRQVLLKRIDLTIQSFLWSVKAKKNKTDIIATFRSIRERVALGNRISIADVMAARTDLCKLEKTSSGETREVAKCELKKLVIGKVPDRGGRPSAEPPPPEMPLFQKRIEPTKDHRGNRRGSGRSFNTSASANRGNSASSGWSRDRGGGGGGRGGSGGWRGRRNDRGYDQGRREGDSGSDKMYFS